MTIGQFAVHYELELLKWRTVKILTSFLGLIGMGIFYPYLDKTCFTPLLTFQVTSLDDGRLQT
jgi:hypothetical protein